MEPDVTVVIPTLDRPAMLRLAVHSALAQRGVRVDIVVVDDGSAPRLNRDAWSHDPRITVVRHDVTLGVATARNAGLARARGRWTAVLDDDDAWAPDKLRRQLLAMRDRQAGWAFTGSLAVSPQGQVVASLDPPPPDDVYARVLTRNAIPAGGSNVIAETALLRRLGGFDESLSHLDDWDMWIRLAGEARAAAVAAPLVAHRHHAANRSFAVAGPLRADFDVLARRYAHQREEMGVTLERADFERYLAWGPRHRGRRLAAAGAYLKAAARVPDPGSLLRAAGMLLGEEAMRRVSGRPRPRPLPAWAEPYLGADAVTLLDDPVDAPVRRTQEPHGPRALRPER
jgi:glycosyltransferase involved in cell wall biosynthesis